MKLQLKYKPNSPHQRKFHSSKAYERLLMTGFGGGKTKAGVAEFTKLCLLNQGCDSLVVALNYPLADKTIVPGFKSLFDDSGIEYTYNSNKHTFHLTDFGNNIYIGSSDVPDSLKGSNVSHVWFDELASMPKEAYTQGIGRNRLRCPTGNKIFHTTTPEGINWVYEEFFLSSMEGREIIIGASWDNVAVDRKYFNDLIKRYTPEQVEMYIHGRFAKGRDGLILPEWDDKWITQSYTSKYYPHYCHYVSLDLGVRDKTAILFGTYFFVESRLYVEREVIMHGSDMTTLSIADAIRKTEHELWKGSNNIRRYSDWNNPLLLQDLSALHGIYVDNAMKDEIEAMVNDTRVFVNGGRLLIHPSCVELIANCNMAKWNPKKLRPDFARTSSLGHMDAMASLLIMKRNIDEYTNPIPVTMMNPFMQHAQIIEANYHVLEEVFK